MSTTPTCEVDGCDMAHGVETFTPDLSNPGETERRCWEHRRLVTLARARQGGCKDYPIPNVDGVSVNESDQWRVVSVERFRELEEQDLASEAFDGESDLEADAVETTDETVVDSRDEEGAETVVETGAPADSDTDPDESEGSDDAKSQASLGDFG